MWTIRMKLKDVLEEVNIKQKELAEITGLSEPAISELASGLRSSINKKNLCIIAEALSEHKPNITMNDLMEFVKQ